MASTRKSYSADSGTLSQPGQRYCDVQGTLTQTRYGWRCELIEIWGSNQGYLEEHGRQIASGRGDTPQEAVFDAKAEALELNMRRAVVAAVCNEILKQVEDEDE